MPYDFCFLFDANNKSGGSLDSFVSYLDHAATCIYTLAIGPMSKKSNSREDNVLREIIKIMDVTAMQVQALPVWYIPGNTLET